MPDLPTFAEAGVAGMDAVTWFAVMAPPGTPDAVVRRTQAAMSAALQMPDVRARYADLGADPQGGTPEETARFVRSEVLKWRGVIQSAKVTVE
jgi:tripartite-type tricarboxylate transporter receptor subunit TctC